MKIYQVTEDEFAPYGKVLAVDVSDMVSVLEGLAVPEGVCYEASLEALEACASRRVIETVFGGMPIQIGYCNGHNRMLDALEYHKSSEVNVAGTDLILLLGKVQDVEKDSTYAAKRTEAFFVPKGTVLEVYGTTLHYAPCQTGRKGFSMVVALPKGTNTDLEAEAAYADSTRSGEEALLFQKNKWLIAHPDAGIEGAFIGLKGIHIEVQESE